MYSNVPFRSVYWSNELAHQHLEKSTFIENQGLEMGRKQIDVNRGHRAAADYDHLYMGRVDQPAAKRGIQRKENRHRKSGWTACLFTRSF